MTVALQRVENGIGHGIILKMSMFLYLKQQQQQQIPDDAKIKHTHRGIG